MNIETIPKLTKTLSDYGYINARVRGMKSALLTGKDWAELHTLANLNEIFNALSTQAMGKTWNINAHSSISQFQEALRRDLCHTTQKLFDITGGRSRQLLEAVLSFWDIENVKTIMRAKYTSSSTKEIEQSIFPIGKLNEALLHELIKSADLGQVLSTLSAWHQYYGKALLKTYYLNQDTLKQTLFPLEQSLDHAFFDELISLDATLTKDELVLRHWLKQLLDIYHFRTANRLRNMKVSEQEQAGYFLGNGNYLNKYRFFDLIHAPSEKDALEMASNILHISKGPENLMELETVLEYRMLKTCTDAYRGNPLEFDILFGFLWIKFAQSRDLRIIIYAKNAQLKYDDYKKDLFYAAV
ncbi:MAG: V-type ATPase subunit [Chlamydiota bacterium]|nr:V-type ATPase subunit [Chlamydiota bacterium]